MVLIYWSVRSSSMRKVDGVIVILTNCCITLLENMNIWCNIQVIIYQLLKLCYKLTTFLCTPNKLIQLLELSFLIEFDLKWKIWIFVYLETFNQLRNHSFKHNSFILTGDKGKVIWFDGKIYMFLWWWDDQRLRKVSFIWTERRTNLVYIVLQIDISLIYLNLRYGIFHYSIL